jgi:hypothetical protein
VLSSAPSHFWTREGGNETIVKWNEFVSAIQDVIDIAEDDILKEFFGTYMADLVFVSGGEIVVSDYYEIAPIEENEDAALEALHTVLKNLLPGMELPEIPPPVPRQAKHVDNVSFIIGWPTHTIEKSIYDAMKRARELLTLYADESRWYRNNINRLEVVCTTESQEQ